ncbi:MAG: preprotein translocase subunit SecE [Tissierellia bacterium]|nr:preprotein translocase subunit SecE [Tissierellia bacterium]
MAKKKDSYLKSVRKESKKINWPTKKTTLDFTSLVLIISVIAGLIIRILDMIFSGLLGLII